MTSILVRYYTEAYWSLTFAIGECLLPQWSWLGMVASAIVIHVVAPAVIIIATVYLI